MNAAQLKELLTSEDIENFVVNALHQEAPTRDNSGNLIMDTFCHGGDSHKLYYYDDSHLFFCYTRDGAMDIYELIQKMGVAHNFFDAYQFVANFFGYGDDWSNWEDEEPEPILTADWDLLSKIDSFTKKKKTKTQQTRILPQSYLNYFSPCIPDLWYQQGISCEAMHKYNIRMDIANKRIIIPHYNFNGDLIGIRCRNLDEEELDNGCPKYMPVPFGLTEEGKTDWLNHPLGDHLYGLNFNKDAIQRTKKVILYESEKAVMLNYTYYKDDSYAVAVCGSALSDTQVNLLLSLGVNEIIIAFDKEGDNFPGSQQTIEYKEKIEGIAARFAPYVNTYYIMDYWNQLGPKDSPADLGKEKLEFLLKKKILVESVSSPLLIKGNKRSKK